MAVALTEIVNDPKVKRVLKPLRPPVPRAIGGPLIVPPLSLDRGYRSRIGKALDMLVRWEIMRRVPGAAGDPFGVVERSAEFFPCWLPVLDEAREIHREFIKMNSIAPAVLKRAIEICVRLSRCVFFGYKPEPPSEHVSGKEVTELLALLSIVPWDELTKEPIHLGYRFSGAEIDLLAGGCLWDFKTTSLPAIEPTCLDQALAYFILLRNEPDAPAIDRGAFLFVRHAKVIAWPVSHWTSASQFAVAEEWLLHEIDRRAVRPVASEAMA